MITSIRRLRVPASGGPACFRGPTPRAPGGLAAATGAAVVVFQRVQQSQRSPARCSSNVSVSTKRRLRLAAGPYAPAASRPNPGGRWPGYASGKPPLAPPPASRHARRTISINDTDATRSAPPMSGQARWLPLRRLSATGAQAAAPRDNPAASAAALDERQAHPVVALCSPHRGPLPDRLGGRRRLGLLRGRRGSGGQ